MYIPNTQLWDCTRVNKYWAYLVDELRSELNARQKIDIELDKMRVMFLFYFLLGTLVSDTNEKLV